MFDRITFDSQGMGGRACIRGLRIPVSLIVGQIAHGATFDEILAGYPDLEREDIQRRIDSSKLSSGLGWFEASLFDVSGPGSTAGRDR